MWINLSLAMLYVDQPVSCVMSVIDFYNFLVNAASVCVCKCMCMCTHIPPPPPPEFVPYHIFCGVPSISCNPRKNPVIYI